MIREKELSEMETILERAPLLQGLKMKLYYNKHQNEIDEGFVNTFKQLLAYAYRLQQEGNLRKIYYINFSILRSAIIDKSYEIRIDLYDKSYCVNSSEISINWNAHFILKFIDEEVDEFISKNRVSIKNIKSYEKNYLKLKCVDIYKQLIYGYIQSNINEITELNEYKNLDKSDDIKILLGEYFDKPEFIIFT